MIGYDRRALWDRAFEEDFFDDTEVESRTYSRTRRRATRRHRLLLDHFGDSSEAWSHRALRSCLESLSTNTSEA